MISIIVAIGENNEIGKKNQLLWHLPADMKHFRKITLGKPVIMGRKTFESIGKPLPNRENIIITSDKNFHSQGIKVVHSLQEALDLTKNQPETMIIGGASIYKQALPISDRLYLTVVHHKFDADAFFPKINKEEWQEIKRKDYLTDTENSYPYSFMVLQRIRK